LSVGSTEASTRVGRILCVDDDAQVRGVIGRVLRSAGHECVPAGDADEARALLQAGPFAVVLCDINLPGRSGLDLLREVRENHPDVATLVVTGRDDPTIADRALGLGAFGYVTKPFAPNDLLIDLSNALHRRRFEAERRHAADRAVRRAYVETLSRLSRAVEYHHGQTGAHIERVGEHAAAIARALGLEEERVELIRLAAPLHDLGKIGVPAELLNKRGPLDDEERVLMHRHTELGNELLGGSGNELLDLAATIAWTHHERWEGGGYPRGLRGDEIPLEGRIVAIADVFDAVTSDRPYSAARSVDEAIAVIASQRGTGFDPDVVDAFIGKCA
jgi:putative two-component system response regulator